VASDRGKTERVEVKAVEVAERKMQVDITMMRVE
jgi:hypothetical protein